MEQRFAGTRFVLKPLDNYDTAGLYLHPNAEQIAQIFDKSKDQYIVQTFFRHPLFPLVNRRGEVAVHQFSLRMGFLAGRCRGIRGASILDTNSYRDHVTPVVVV